jgi:hypothetical protein
MRFNVGRIFCPRKMGQWLRNKKKAFFPVFVVLIAHLSAGIQKKTDGPFFA